MATGDAFRKMLDFMSLVGQLKRVKRTGWVLREVTEPESVADHMYRMAVLSLCFGERGGLNTNRCIKLSLVHDLAECIVGDIAPTDGISKEEKQRREENAMKSICNLLHEDAASEIFSLWEEYESQQSKEAQFVKDLDRWEMILQAHEYEQSHNRGKFLQEFFDSTHGKFRTAMVGEWANRLDSHRNTDATPSQGKVGETRTEVQKSLSDRYSTT